MSDSSVPVTVVTLAPLTIQASLLSLSPTDAPPHSDAGTVPERTSTVNAAPLDPGVRQPIIEHARRHGKWEATVKRRRNSDWYISLDAEPFIEQIDRSLPECPTPASGR